MKMMEILDIRIQCLNEVVKALKKQELDLIDLESISLAAQEYYTTGLLQQDILATRKDTSPRACLYGSTPQGAQQIINKYNLSPDGSQRFQPLSNALRSDIEGKIIQPDGSINYANPTWIKSRVLRADHKYLYPQDGLATILAKILAQRIK